MTRHLFGTDGIRGTANIEPMTAETALRVAMATALQFRRGDHRHRVVIGKDTRLSGYMLEPALTAGFISMGMDVVLVGPLPTPAVAMLTRSLRADMGVMISASHNPYQDNGIKFFSAQGMKLPDELEAEIEAALDEELGCVSSEGLGRARRMNDAQGRYIEFCKSTFPNDLDLNGLSIVVDAAHGAAYNIAPHVFRELGADVHAIGVHPDGFNINKGVGALHPDQLAREVKARGAQLGIALDGDADRLQMVDGDGRIYNGDELLYAILRERMQRGTVEGVVGTLMTNFGFERALERLGVGFARANVGDRYVLEQMQARGWLYGGESSGHLLCLDCHTTGDGIIAALQVLTALRRNDATLADWVSDLRMYPQKMINVPLAPGLDWKTHPGLAAAREAVEAELGGRGRILIRASGTEPKLRVMVEAEDEALAVSSAERLAASLG